MLIVYNVQNPPKDVNAVNIYILYLSIRLYTEAAE